METIVHKDNYLAELLQFYRVQRHDFLNHFQVVMGYIQLGKVEKALEYLKQAAEVATVKASMSRVSTPELAVELLKTDAVCFALGIGFNAVCDEELPVIYWSSTYAAGMDILREEVRTASGLELVFNPWEHGVILQARLAGVDQEQLHSLAEKLAILDLPVQKTELRGEPVLTVFLKS